MGKIKFKLFIIGLVAFCLILNMVSAIDLNCSTNLVSRWKFSDNINDYCGRNNGTLIGGIYVDGICGKGISFDGINDYVNIPNSSSLNINDNLTIAFWVYPYAIITSDVFLTKNYAYEIRFPATNPDRIQGRFYRSGWKDIAISDDMSISQDNWIFVAVTYNMTEPEEVKIYINGTLNTTQIGYTGTGSIDISDYNLTMGSDLSAGGWINAIIDEVFIFKKILNATEIYELYQLTSLPCVEDWSVQYTPCNISDNRTKYYQDLNDCGTNLTLPADNGTIQYCNYCSANWICTQYNQSCGDTAPQPDMVYCLNVTDLNYASCCNITGLSSDCNYTGDFSIFNKLCGEIDVVLVVPNYPYADLNVSYPMNLYLYQNGVSKNLTDFKIKITDPYTNISYYNFTWDSADNRYELNLIFTEEGNYPFTIYAQYPYDKIQNITGMLIVKDPFYITIRFYEFKDKDISKYENDFAYLFAELKDPNKYYDTTLETFITPLLFKTIYDTPVFHTTYDNGEATLKLWEKNRTYNFRLVDGVMTFSGVYVVPNITKTYGTNIFIPDYYLNGTTTSYDIYLSEREISPYTWILNWGLIASMIIIIFTAIALFFIIPTHPQLSIIFGLGFGILLVILRVLIWFFKGW